MFANFLIRSGRMFGLNAGNLGINATRIEIFLINRKWLIEITPNQISPYSMQTSLESV